MHCAAAPVLVTALRLPIQQITRCSKILAFDAERKEKGFDAESNETICVKKKTPTKSLNFFSCFFSPQVCITTALPHVLNYTMHTRTCTYSTSKYHPNFVRFIQQ